MTMRRFDRDQFAGLHVLVVEDEYLVACHIAHLLHELGCTVVGPASTSDEAVMLLKSQHVDAAVLDINLIKGTSEPVARELRYRRCPFIFVTGFSEIGALPHDLRGYCILAKPVSVESLASALHNLNIPERA